MTIRWFPSTVSRSRATTCPQVETLEDRVVPAALGLLSAVAPPVLSPHTLDSAPNAGGLVENVLSRVVSVANDATRAASGHSPDAEKHDHDRAKDRHESKDTPATPALPTLP